MTKKIFLNLLALLTSVFRFAAEEEHFHTTVHATLLEGYKPALMVTPKVPQISEPVVEKPAPEPIPDTKLL